MQFNQGHALMIGIGSYQYATNLNVPQTAEDAELVARILRDEQFCGYPDPQICVLAEAKATRERILAELTRLATTLHVDDTLFVFYSGHGMKGDDGYYLTTYDTRVTEGKVVAGTGIRERELLERIKAIGTHRALLVFNACHAGVLAPASLGEPTEEPATLGETLPQVLTTALLSAGEGRSIITACREEQRSWFSRAEPTTLFAQVLADGLQGRDINPRRGYISLFDLYDYVHTTVSGAARRRWGETQEPELTISKGVGVMALALYRGATPSGELGLEDRPRALGGAVHEVEQAESKRTYQQILSGQINLAAGHDLHYDAHEEVHIDARRAQGFIYKPQGSVTQHFGDEIKVGNISGSSGVAIGRGARATVYGSGGTPSTASTPISLTYALGQTRSAAQEARTQGYKTLAEDLEGVVSNLEAALNAETTGDAARRSTKLSRARDDLQDLAQQESGLGTLAALVVRVQ